MSATRRSFFCAVGLFSALAGPVRAQTPAPAEAENGRFAMTPVANGFLRLDTKTGQTSLCTTSADQAQCRAGADERAALEAEIARLSKENAALKAGAAAPPALAQQDEEDRRFNRAMDRAETFMRRMLRLFRETEKPAPPSL
ncbi:hypothetical protein CCR94_16935 [Rhodoblastus sphagnicola]|uniref:Uncharacterized protein n=1 Tax=Rhodoblastus sphagnicola TaxID=333368 RepID=A0A2S6N2H2_9HYPH|nr:hypothetical protein [Rhodoblastus sphagnicola]MBB4197325.1 hypothetical protein [Rhodoblastus sphagnicola]PPQ28798.1 hypothetical protein CCR94_16935 [Rhodoblastus sphagnicola]